MIAYAAAGLNGENCTVETSSGLGRVCVNSIIHIFTYCGKMKEKRMREYELACDRKNKKQSVFVRAVDEFALLDYRRKHCFYGIYFVYLFGLAL